MPNSEASGPSTGLRFYRVFLGAMVTALSAGIIGAWTTLVDMRDAIKRMEERQGYEAQSRAQRDSELTAQIERVERDAKERNQYIWNYLWRQDGKR